MQFKKVRAHNGFSWLQSCFGIHIEFKLKRKERKWKRRVAHCQNHFIFEPITQMDFNQPSKYKGGHHESKKLL
jgi:hypothetical protein